MKNDELKYFKKELKFCKINLNVTIFFIAYSVLFLIVNLISMQWLWVVVSVLWIVYFKHKLKEGYDYFEKLAFIVKFGEVKNELGKNVTKSF